MAHRVRPQTKQQQSATRHGHKHQQPRWQRKKEAEHIELREEIQQGQCAGQQRGGGIKHVSIFSFWVDVWMDGFISGTGKMSLGYIRGVFSFGSISLLDTFER